MPGETTATMTPLGERIAASIARLGPITVADYMAEVLTHPEHGYYMPRRALRRARRLRDRTGDQPDIRRTDRPCGAPRPGNAWVRRRGCSWSSWAQGAAP